MKIDKCIEVRITRSLLMKLFIQNKLQYFNFCITYAKSIKSCMKCIIFEILRTSILYLLLYFSLDYFCITFSFIYHPIYYYFFNHYSFKYYFFYYYFLLIPLFSILFIKIPLFINLYNINVEKYINSISFLPYNIRQTIYCT